jgi:hypothetical protein
VIGEVSGMLSRSVIGEVSGMLSRSVIGEVQSYESFKGKLLTKRIVELPKSLTQRWRMKFSRQQKWVLLALLVLLLPITCLAQDVKDVLTFISGPQSLANWLSRNFHYEWEFSSNDWQTSQEMLESKKGDCEDFATLASDILEGLGYSSHIIIIKFRDLNIKHAICAFEEKDGTYSFISNKELIQTGKRNAEDAVAMHYPDWESISFVKKGRKYIKTVKKINRKFDKRRDLL